MSAPTIVPVRSSSWGELFDCSRRWAYKHVDGLKTPMSMAGHLGISIHKSTAVFDQGRIDGSGVTVDDTLGVLDDALKNPPYDVERKNADLSERDAALIAAKLHVTYCTDISPQYEFRAVEFNVDGIDVVTPHLTIRMTGTTDRLRVRRTGNGIAVSDVKTGQRAVGSDGHAVVKGHKPQLGAYEMLAEQKLEEPIVDDAEIIGLQTTKTTKVGVGRVSNAKEMMLGTEGEPGMIEVAALILRAGVFPANSKSMLCSPKYCPGYSRCKWHE